LQKCCTGAAQILTLKAVQNTSATACCKTKGAEWEANILLSHYPVSRSESLGRSLALPLKAGAIAMTVLKMPTPVAARVAIP
jgi:hypothetical protein